MAVGACSVMSCVPTEFLRECFSYSPSEGGLFWSPFRPRSHFLRDADHDGFLTLRAGSKAGSLCPYGYCKIGFTCDAQYYIATEHYLVWRIFDRPYNPELEFDHINGVRNDNRIENLRQVTTSQNMLNRKKSKRNKSGVVGVRRAGSSWEAYASINGKQVCLGRFKHKADAVAARREAELKYHGEFARPDFLR